MSSNRVGPEDENKYGKAREFDPNFHGPMSKRSCTDVICCILFVIFLAGYAAISALGFVYGDPRLLIFATDSNGELCGYGNMYNKPFLFYFDLAQCAKVTVSGFKCPTPQICVAACPDYFWNWPQAELTNDRAKMICYYGVNATTDGRSISQLVLAGVCAPYIVPEGPTVSRCIPKVVSDSVNYLTQASNNTQLNFSSSLFQAGISALNVVIGWVGAVFNDLLQSWPLILVGLAFGALLSLLWLVLLRFLAALIVWFLLLSFIAVFGASTGYTVYQFIAIEGWNTLSTVQLSTDFNSYLTQGWFWLTLAIISGLIFLIIVVVVLFLRKRIRIATELISQASKALGYMLEALIFPILPFACHMGVITYFAYLAASLATLKTTKNDVATNTSSSWSNWTTYCGNQSVLTDACKIVDTYVLQSAVVLQLFNLFMALWLFFFVTGMSQITIAGSFASYYFAFRKPQDIPCCGVARSFARVLRYHLGTVAFGSLLIALVKFVRAILEYVKSKTTMKNVFARFCLKCLSCCLWCLEKFLKFITKNAYIMTAIRGKNFCVSAKDAFFLIMRNFLRALTLDKVTSFLILIGELVVVGAVGVASYFIFTGQVPFVNTFLPPLNYFYVPIIFVVIGTFIVAVTFFSVYEMGVDTLFLCFLEDLEMNDGSPEKPYYMSKGLRRILGKKNRKPEKNAKKQKGDKQKENESQDESKV